MTETQEQQQHPTWRFGGPLDLTVPAAGKEHCPSPVWEASENLRQANAAHQQAKAQQQAAQAALTQPKAADEASDRVAVLANSKMVNPAAAAPKAAQAVQLADRRVKATSAQVHDTQIELADAIFAHHATWSANVQQGRNDLRVDIIETLGDLTSLFTKLSTSDRTEIGLSHYPTYAVGSGSLLGINFGENERINDRAGEALQQLKTSIAQGSSHGVISRNDTYGLLAALTVIASPVERVVVSA
jgi:hypothetical protein